MQLRSIRRTTEREKEEIKWQATMRLVEAIILQVLDEVSISGKWYNRYNISMMTLNKKKEALYEIGKWMKTKQWDTWCSIYTEYVDTNRTNIKRQFEKTRKKSQRYVTKRIKEARNN